jgi:hypothetical protein
MTTERYPFGLDDVVLVELEGYDPDNLDDEELYPYLSSTLPAEVEVPTDAHALYSALVYYAERGELEGIMPTHREIAQVAGFAGLGSSVRLTEALGALEEAQVIEIDVFSARPGHTLTTITLLGPERRKSGTLEPRGTEQTGV